jgi:glutaryl-CoA dehydrogenase
MTITVPSKDLMSLFQQIDLQAVAQLAQRVDLNQIISTLGAMDPQDVARLLQRFRPSDEREPPPIEGDFYEIAAALTPEERAVQMAIRDYMEREVRPVIGEYWDRGEFPRALLPSFAEMIRATVGAEPYDFQVANSLLLGIAFMEMARVDPSMSTFFGVHWGLCMGSIALFGSDEQRARWLAPLQRFEQVGSWALTEPEVGSATAAGLTTTARREGDTWVINGTKKWSGNATFADVTVIWARDVADDQVKGFLIERGTPGYTVEKLHGKMALRAVENVLITLQDCRVAEGSRLAGVQSFRDVARQLASARVIVAWKSAGLAMGAYERALAYSTSRRQFGKPIGSFQLVQNMLVQMLANVTAMQTMLLRLAQLEARDGMVAQERASLAKVFCGEKMRETVALARGLVGGNGILLDYEVGRYFADAEALYSYEGTHEMNTLIVGRAITGRSAFV